MEREIKFRGRDIDGTWHYGHLFQGRTDNGIDYSVILTQKRDRTDDRLPEDMPFAFYKDEIFVVVPNTVGQYTGLKDKNKEDVYEGDILRSVRFEDIILFVAYDEEEASFMAVQINKNRGTDLESRCHITQKWLDEYPKVVIGNIYDNPKLLEEDEK